MIGALLRQTPAPHGVHSPWLWRHGSHRDGSFRLFCVPCAGHGASTYAAWAAHLPRGVELWALQPPGRENRFGEVPITDMTNMVSSAAGALDPLLGDRPFAIVGHSMGALIAFELTRELRRRRRPLPRHLFVSGYPAPQEGWIGPLRCHLPDPMFLSSVAQLNTNLAQDHDYLDAMRLMLPTLRADFTLCERYRYVDDEPLPCNLTAWGGEADVEAGLTQLVGWREQTSGAFSLKMFSGDHFFLWSHRQIVLCELSGALAPLIC